MHLDGKRTSVQARKGRLAADGEGSAALSLACHGEATCPSLRGPVEEAEVPGLLQALAGQPEGDRALLGWATTGDWSTQAFRADDGMTVDLGGGCGGGGEVLAYCAVQGNAEFELRLRNAVGGVAALAVIGLETPGLACGPCMFFPNPAASVSVPAGLTSQAGTASVSAPIPNVPSIVGASVVEQWLTLGGGGCLGGVLLSNGLRVQLQ